MNGASIALAISDIPWNGPIAGMAVGLVDGQVVTEPHAGAEAKKRPLQLTVAGPRTTRWP